MPESLASLDLHGLLLSRAIFRRPSKHFGLAFADRRGDISKHEQRRVIRGKLFEFTSDVGRKITLAGELCSPSPDVLTFIVYRSK